MRPSLPPSNHLVDTQLYDVECYPNYFLVCVRRYGKQIEGGEDGRISEFVYRIDARAQAKKILCDDNVWHVGHNVLHYDDIMLLAWLSGANQAQLFALNQYLIVGEKPSQDKDGKGLAAWIAANINTRDVKRFGQVKKEHSVNWKSPAASKFEWNKRSVIDTLVLGENAGSLKNAAIVLGVVDLVDAPVPFGKILTYEQIKLIDDYCWHDIVVTDTLIRHYAKNLEIRSRFAALGIDRAYSVGSAKLAELYLMNRHMLSLPNEYVRGQWKEHVTKVGRSFSDEARHVVDLIGDYKISYYDERLQAFWSMLSKCELVFDSSILTANVDMAEASSDEADAWRKNEKAPSPYRVIGGGHVPKGDLLVTDSRGMRYKFGVGGLHNDAPRGVWRESKTHTIINVDVKSYYPSLIASNNFAPRQFPEMAAIEGSLKIERVMHKDAGREADADALKLVLNSAFGKMKDRYSPLNDPPAHFSVTISGQLLLLRLIDMTYLFCPSAEVINANTDGVCFRMLRSEEPALRAVMKEWERTAKVELDLECYKSWAQASCNNYCARRDIGKIKTKGGDFKIYPMAMKETMKQAPAIKKMIIVYLLSGVHPRETLSRLIGEKPSDFLFSCSFGKTSPMLGGERLEGRRALRYAWTTDGKLLQVEQSNGIKQQAKGKLVTLVDDLESFTPAALAIDAYVEEAMMQILRVVYPYKTQDLPAKVMRNIQNTFETWHKENEHVVAISSKN